MKRAVTFVSGMISGLRMRVLPIICAVLLVALAGCGSGGVRHDSWGGEYWGSGQGDLSVSVQATAPDGPIGTSYELTLVLDGLDNVTSSGKFEARSGTHFLESSYRLKADPARSYTIRATMTRLDTGKVVSEKVVQAVVEEDHLTTRDIDL